MSTPGASSRLTADQTPATGAAGDGIFPELLAGLVAANGAAAGIETLLKEILAAPHGESAALVEDAGARPAAKREPAARRASSPAPSGTAPKLAASKPEPDPAPLAAWQTNSAIQIRPTYIIAAMLGDLSGESGVQPNGQTASVAAVPPQIVYAGHPPNAPMAMPLATANPAGTEVEGAPASHISAASVAARAAAQPGAPTSIAVNGIPPATFPAPVEPADELPGVQPKPVAPMTAQAALAPARPGTPPATRPRSADPEDVVRADETTVRAALPAPPPAAGPADSSSRLAPRTQAATPTSRRSSGSVVAQVLALSGQVPRTVDSIPAAALAPLPLPAFRPGEGLPGGSRPALEPPAPTVPADPASPSPAESLIPGAGTQIRVLGTGTPDRDEVAFALQVRATPTPEGSAQHASPAGIPAAEGGEPTLTPAQPGGVPVPDPAAASQKRTSLPDAPDQTPARAGRERHPDAAPLERPGPGAGATAGKMNPQASLDGQVRTETGFERPQAALAPEAKPVRPQDVQEVMDGAAKPEALKAPVVRDMKFEVTGGQQRVEVRLSERAGEVKMTVRTADEPLADTLRENLPALNARLAESGFKSEAWHPAASSTNELRHAAESGARGASHETNQDADAQQRQQDREPPDGAAQRRPHSPQEAAPQKEKGKDFSWLMSSLR